MDIALCFDNNFFMQAGATIKSICLSNPEENIVFHLFTNNITDYNKEILNGLLITTKQLIRFYNIDESILTGWPVVSRYPKSIYYRFFITQAIPSSVKYILYLDCDIIVRSSLKELFEIDLNNNIIAAVYDKMPFEIDTINRLSLPIENGYFNSGVLLIDVQEWKTKDITSKLRDLIQKNPEKLIFPDQDALNILFNGNWEKLHLKYNFQQGFIYKHTKLYWRDFKELYEAQLNPTIIHFSGIKPWRQECNNPYKQVWYDVIKHTPWKDFKPIKRNIFHRVLLEIKYFLFYNIHVPDIRHPFSENCNYNKLNNPFK